VLVATPIGNLGDLSPRAAEVLAQADVVCCEDTRRTRALLSAAGIAGAGRLVAVHAHNEAARAAEVRDWLDQGRLVALVTDAGTPGVSDPGRRLVVAAADAGHRVTAVPGPSAVLAALSLSGLDTDRFSVEGFLPRKGAARRERLAALSRAPVTTVVLEAPTRLAATLAELAGAGPDRPVCVARELTKVHEEVWRGTLAEAVTHFAAAPVKGEVVLVLGAVPPVAPGTDEVTALARARLEAGESPRAAAEHVAAALGVSRRVAYEAALAARDEAGAD
jgi:16S rRNA (cytidine1402-2'-O)-methyltransferase